MADHSKPGLGDLYAQQLAYLRARLDDLAKMLDPASTTATNLPADSIALSTTAGKWLKWNGSGWVDAVTTYSINTSGNSGSASKLATAKKINNVDFDGSQAISINLNNAVTFNNAGGGAASGSSFVGGAPLTVSYNTIGAQQASADLSAIAGLAATPGLIRKTGAGTYTLDTSSYLTGITSQLVTNALGYTPVNPSSVGAANGVAPLGADQKVPAINLPSYVDDVLEYANYASLPATGESGKIYVLATPYTSGGVTSSQFRWSGSAYAAIIASPGSTDAVTEGSSNLYFTAARADSRITALVYDWARSSVKPTYTKAEVGLGNVDNTADSAKSVNYANSAGSAPASDVYTWAKQATKPSYTKVEVGLSNVDNTADSAKSVNYANSAGSAANGGVTSVNGKTGAVQSVPTLISLASTSGSAIDFTSIPSWVQRITVSFVGVSTNGGAVVQFQLGTSGGIQTSGYVSTGYAIGSSVGTSTTGLAVDHAIVNSNFRQGVYVLTKVSGNLWCMSGIGTLSDVTITINGTGYVTLSGALTTLRVTTTNGTDSFDGGTIGLLYE